MSSLHTSPPDSSTTNDAPLAGVVSWLKRVVGRQSPEHSTIKEALEEVLEEHISEGEEELSIEEKDMLRNMLSVGDVTSRDVMVPRSDIAGIEINTDLNNIKKRFVDERHTRMPVYAGNLDAVKGFIHLKDLIPSLAGDETFQMVDILREVLFVPPSMKIVDLLVQMRLSGEHMALVIDEYGGTDGLVTMEDLFEEIVGEIQDEHDAEEEEPECVCVGENNYTVDARCMITDVEKKLDIALSEQENDEDVDTIGGLVFLRLGRVPARGELIQLNDRIGLEVLEADPRRIRSLRMTINSTTLEAAS